MLLAETKIPRQDELPDDLKPLAHKHAIRNKHERFNADIEELIKQLLQIIEKINATAKELAEQEKGKRNWKLLPSTP